MRKSLAPFFIVVCCSLAQAQTMRLGVSAGFGPTWLKVKGPDLDPRTDVRAAKASLNEEFSRPIAFTFDIVPDNGRFIYGFDIGYQKTEKSTGSSRGSSNVNYLEASYSFLHVGPNTKLVFNPRNKFKVYLKASPYVSFILNSSTTYESFTTLPYSWEPQKSTGVWSDPRKILLSYDAGLGFTYSFVYLELKGMGSFVNASKGPKCEVTTAYVSLGFRFLKFNDN